MLKSNLYNIYNLALKGFERFFCFGVESKMYGAQGYEFNLDKTLNNCLFDKHIYGKSSAVLPAFIKELLGF